MTSELPVNRRYPVLSGCIMCLPLYPFTIEDDLVVGLKITEIPWHADRAYRRRYIGPLRDGS
jgi:hypothetical protein